MGIAMWDDFKECCGNITKRIIGTASYTVAGAGVVALPTLTAFYFAGAAMAPIAPVVAVFAAAGAAVCGLSRLCGIGPGRLVLSATTGVTVGGIVGSLLGPFGAAGGALVGGFLGGKLYKEDEDRENDRLYRNLIRQGYMGRSAMRHQLLHDQIGPYADILSSSGYVSGGFGLPVLTGSIADRSLVSSLGDIRELEMERMNASVLGAGFRAQMTRAACRLPFNEPMIF